VDEPSGAWTKWQYDAIGNRISHQTHTAPTPTPYEYYKYGGNPNNSSRLKQISSSTYTYDANGNSLRVSAVWDLMNRLLSYGGTTYEYEAATGRRLKRGDITYLYRGEDMIREKNTTTGVVTDYLFGDGIDEPLVARTEAGVKTYFAVDGLGSIVAGIDSAGTVVQAQAYNAWGGVTKGGTGYSFGYTGREPGPATLLYYRARYYEPATGRFLSEDPIGFSAGDINFYRYVFANPVALKDPLGLDTAGCDGLKGRLENPCEKECCAAHDNCFDAHNCSSGSWGKPKCECDKTPQCKKCNSDVLKCFSRCSIKFGIGIRKKPNYYCARLHRYINIPGDFPSYSAAIKACEYDHSKDCRTKTSGTPPKP
jgi:RHS repeat-associated protein